MSQEINDHKRSNNEEVVDEITKDLEKDLLECQFSYGDKVEESSPGCSKNNEDCKNDKDTTESTSENSDEPKPKHDEDFIDEDLLKKAEENVSDEEKEIRKKESLKLKSKGNDQYNNKDYFESVKTYTEALKLCPLKYTSERSVFYANRAASKINVDRKKSAIEDCTKSIELNERYVRAYLRRAKLFEEDDKLDESLEDYKKIIEIDPGNIEALQASQRLPPKINERNEKLKDEMLGKLKDLGNMILKPFGLSTNNFNMVQNPDSGGYSINFNQNQKT